ncbi:hypothetical protein HYV79_01610 [Candidatus Woesearchaeota archaeon]|nr:hypothetical protein [Candidatus Woesearchaeota archaeon]
MQTKPLLESIARILEKQRPNMWTSSECNKDVRRYVTGLKSFTMVVEGKQTDNYYKLTVFEGQRALLTFEGDQAKSLYDVIESNVNTMNLFEHRDILKQQSLERLKQLLT